jgi:hypothetical protein
MMDAGQRTLQRAEDVSRMGYMPYMGPDVAAMTPLQNAAMQSTNQAAAAFGMPTAQGGLPAPQTFAGGVQGYSSAPIMQQALSRLSPQQQAALRRGLLG